MAQSKLVSSPWNEWANWIEASRDFVSSIWMLVLKKVLKGVICVLGQFMKYIEEGIKHVPLVFQDWRYLWNPKKIGGKILV